MSINYEPPTIFSYYWNEVSSVLGGMALQYREQKIKFIFSIAFLAIATALMLIPTLFCAFIGVSLATPTGESDSLIQITDSEELNKFCGGLIGVIFGLALTILYIGIITPRVSSQRRRSPCCCHCRC